MSTRIVSYSAGRRYIALPRTLDTYLDCIARRLGIAWAEAPAAVRRLAKLVALSRSLRSLATDQARRYA